MTPAFEKFQKLLKQLPGLGYRSSERIALDLLVEHPERVGPLVTALQEAAKLVRPCPRCGNISEGGLCAICLDVRRQTGVVCVVEHVPDLAAIERSGVFKDGYHILNGKLSPLNQVGPESLNLKSLFERVTSGEIKELILAVSNDVEGEATCHYIIEHLPSGYEIEVSRIGFGLPSGAGVVYADSSTLKTALEGRRAFQ
jgi:recombination protein RecR